MHSIDLDTDAKRHLMDIGLTKGTSITVKNLAPLGDPMEIIIRGSDFSITKKDAQQIIVELEE
ncbi:MAG: FeoA domain-containing protein [Coriobacteriales bacterium]|nr:FeoA domain-containing protein [Coriobacteriales bacterium]